MVWADMNGDGRLDIVVAGKTGTWLLTNQAPPSELRVAQRGTEMGTSLILKAETT